MYTTQIRWILEMSVKGTGLNPNIMTPDQIIEKGMGSVFKFDWDYHGDKNAFQKQFLRHYYMQEIGQETVALFRMSLQDSLGLIMPKYNALLDSEKLQFDRISNYSFKRTVEDLETQLNKDKQDTTDDSTGTSHTFNKFADTPQNVVDKIMGHLSSADESDGKTTGNYTRDYKAQEDRRREYGSTVKETGYNGTDPNSLLTSYRSTILEINREIITDPEILKCFMGVW